MEITKLQFEIMRAFYPDVDIEQECGLMRGWLSAHPKRRLTMRFVQNWLKKEQRRASERKRESQVGANPFTEVRVKPDALRRAAESGRR